MEDFCSVKLALEKIKAEVAKKVVGKDSLIEDVLACFIAGGHVLIEGLPGLAKTLIVKTFASLLGLSFKRIQFTPDLLPSDLIGTLIFLQHKAKFSVRRGSLFANLVLLDEINRAPAKVQSALLEAMEEKQITIGRKTYPLPNPFFVLATENPIEEEGTYPLSEAQKDRFLMKLLANYPTYEQEIKIVEEISKSFFFDDEKKIETKVGEAKHTDFLEPIFPNSLLLQFRKCASEVIVSKEITEYIVSIVSATRPELTKKLPYFSYIDFGASPRASIALHSLSKVVAMFEGRNYVMPDDVKRLSYPVLRHRLKLSYEAIAENITADEIISSILSIVPQS
ncbi:MAG: AAA family ATPase [Treponema sp.]